MKLKSKEELMAVQRQLTVEKRAGGRVAPKKQFVLSSSWDTNLHGAWDPSKEVETEIGGVKRVGREGVYDFEEYEDTAVSAFSEQAFGWKKDALQAAVSSQARARDAAAVKDS